MALRPLFRESSIWASWTQSREFDQVGIPETVATGLCLAIGRRNYPEAHRFGVGDFPRGP